MAAAAATAERTDAGTGGSGGTGGAGADAGGEPNHGNGGAAPSVPTPGCTGEPRWLDITSAKIAELGGADAQSYPAGVSRVVLNPLNGDLTIRIVGIGLWRSDDKGDTWSRIDDNVVDKSGARSETGWGLQIDPDDATRIASFTPRWHRRLHARRHDVEALGRLGLGSQLGLWSGRLVRFRRANPVRRSPRDHTTARCI